MQNNSTKKQINPSRHINSFPKMEIIPELSLATLLPNETHSKTFNTKFSVSVKSHSIIIYVYNFVALM